MKVFKTQKFILPAAIISIAGVIFSYQQTWPTFSVQKNAFDYIDAINKGLLIQLITIL